jgi:hypothetical protein
MLKTVFGRGGFAPWTNYQGSAHDPLWTLGGPRPSTELCISKTSTSFSAWLRHWLVDESWT